MDIQLDEGGYRVPGVGVVPRVSELLDLLDHPAKRDAIRRWERRCLARGLQQIPPADQGPADDVLVDLAMARGGRSEAADRGTEIHHAVASMLEGHWNGAHHQACEWAVSLVKDLMPAAAAAIEEPVYVPQLGVAGTPDVAAWDADGGVVIIDWKTGRMDSRRWRRQLTCYALGFVPEGAAMRLYAANPVARTVTPLEPLHHGLREAAAVLAIARSPEDHRTTDEKGSI
jgi:hypothetical protein